MSHQEDMCVYCGGPRTNWNCRFGLNIVCEPCQDLRHEIRKIHQDPTADVVLDSAPARKIWAELERNRLYNPRLEELCEVDMALDLPAGTRP